ncbi:MAG TPA: ATPase, T2SS/T4P/T4SS family, partial [Candidatus Eremiobacteraeota bacterium]|nr:ATPase, T2SS/T4P/T4SS family [Candidatus Eremiobacteraeota bacterium]
ITQEQLETALEAQKEFKTRLGRTLVQLGYVTEDDINWALSNQFDISYVHLNIHMIDIAIARSVPREVLEFYQMIPIARIDKELTLVMADPTDNQAVETIKSITGCNVSISLSSSSNILSIIRQIFKEEPQHEIQHSDIEGIKSLEYKREIRRLVTRDFDSGIFIYTTILRALELKAAEIHLEPGQDLLKVRYKIEGVFYEYASKPMNLYTSIMVQLESIIKSGDESLGVTGNKNFTIRVMEQYVRVSAFFAPTFYGQAIVLKIIPFIKEPIKLSDMDIDEKTRLDLSALMKRSSGVILISSPSKIDLSRTLYAMLREVSFTDKKVVTLEDFITFRREGFIQIEYSSLKGIDDYEALKIALGQNPDILMISIDLQPGSFKLAFELALTGKLLLIALPFQNVYTCFGYINSIVTESYITAGVLQGIFAQRMFRKLCINCKQSVTSADFPFLPEEFSHNVFYEKGKGCSTCNFSGYAGQSLLYEYYWPSREDRMKILTSGLPGQDIFIPSNYKTIKENCQEKVLDGLLSVSEIINI